MRFIAYLRLRRLGLTDEAANHMCAFEEPDLGNQDDVAVGWVIAAIFGAYLLVQVVESFL